MCPKAGLDLTSSKVRGTKELSVSWTDELKDLLIERFLSQTSVPWEEQHRAVLLPRTPFN